MEWSLLRKWCGVQGVELKECYSPRMQHAFLKERIEPRLAYRESGKELADWRRELVTALREAIGLPEPSIDLNPRKAWTREEPDGRIERWEIDVEEGASVPMYLAIPHGTTGPIPFIICLQGHSTGMHVSLAFDREDEETRIEVKGDRDLARQCLANGVGALCVEQRAFGLRRDPVSEARSAYGLCSDAAMHALVLGRTLVGERVFDVMRAIEFLKTRPEVAASAIGIMGNSAGGTISLYATALSEDIAFAVPSSCFCEYKESWLRACFCPCGFVPGLAALADLPDILGLAAPKPVAVIVGREDRGFPTDAVQRAFDRLQEIYAAAGAAGNCRLYLGEEGHRFYAQPAWAFIREHVLKET
jgi:dienelactone hydrolase